MTEALAIIGAVTGVTGSILALLSFSRDRAKVVVSHSQVTTSRGEDAPKGTAPVKPGGPYEYVIVFVANHGRQPIAITAAGLMERRRLRFSQRLRKVLGAIAEGAGMVLYRAGVSRERLNRWYERLLGDWGSPQEGRSFWPAIDEPVLLGLAELARYELPSPFREWQPQAPGRLWPIYAYATDSYGRTSLSQLPLHEPSEGQS